MLTFLRDFLTHKENTMSDDALNSPAAEAIQQVADSTATLPADSGDAQQQADNQAQAVNIIVGSVPASGTIAPADQVIDAATSQQQAVPVTQAPPRPLDQIHQDLQQAIQAHAAAVLAVQNSQTVLDTLKAEFHAGITWFAEKEKELVADLDDAASNTESWVMRRLKAL